MSSCWAPSAPADDGEALRTILAPASYYPNRTGYFALQDALPHIQALHHAVARSRSGFVIAFSPTSCVCVCFFLVPAMIYLLGMPVGVVIGTSLFQITFVTATATFLHASSTQTVDVMLAGILTLGAVFGAQFGTRVGAELRGEELRGLLALVVLGVCVTLLWRLVADRQSLHPSPRGSIETPLVFAPGGIPRPGRSASRRSISVTPCHRHTASS